MPIKITKKGIKITLFYIKLIHFERNVTVGLSYDSYGKFTVNEKILKRSFLIGTFELIIKRYISYR